MGAETIIVRATTRLLYHPNPPLVSSKSSPFAEILGAQGEPGLRKQKLAERTSGPKRRMAIDLSVGGMLRAVLIATDRTREYVVLVAS